MLAVCLMFGGATLVAAQDQSATQQSQTETMDQDRQRISVSQLPDQVSSKLESQDYSGWTVDGAYSKQDDEKGQIYIIELRQGNETKKVKFDAQGNEIDKKDKNKRDGQSHNYRQDDESAAGQSSSESDLSTTPDQP